MTRPDYCPIAQEPCQAMCVFSDVRCKIRENTPQVAPQVTQQEKQEPVAWWREDGSICTDERQAGDHDIPLYTHRRLIPRDYTAPPQRQPLTMRDIAEAARDAQIAVCLDKHKTFEEALTRAIERKHGIGGGK